MELCLRWHPPPNVSGGDGAQIKAVLLWTYNESRWYGEIHYVGKDRGYETARQAADQVDGWSDRGGWKKDRMSCGGSRRTGTAGGLQAIGSPRVIRD